MLALLQKGNTERAVDVAILLLLFAIVMGCYLLPTIVALKRQHPQLVPIAILNVLLGWSFIGWVVALIWASLNFFRKDLYAGPEATARYNEQPRDFHYKKL